MASRPVAETVAQINAENDEAARALTRRTDALLQSLNWYANRGELSDKSMGDILATAQRLESFLEIGATGSQFNEDYVEFVNGELEQAKNLIGGWLAYIRSDVVSRETYVSLVGDSAIFLSEVGG